MEQEDVVDDNNIMCKQEIKKERVEEEEDEDKNKIDLNTILQQTLSSSELALEDDNSPAGKKGTSNFSISRFRHCFHLKVR